MKRSRPLPLVADAVKGEELGAVEFAAILNGEDPRQIYQALQKFTRIVQRERRLALSVLNENEERNRYERTENNDDDGDTGTDSSSSSEDSAMADATATATAATVTTSTTTTKRFKASESWKEDTQQYHVPFVGTSVAKETAAPVVVGEWPTGFLKAYLTKSVKAAELTSAELIPPTGHVHRMLLKQKQGKLSQLIYKSYLKALSELVTAAIPSRVLLGEDNDSATNENDESQNTPENQRFLQAILQERLPTLWSVLQTETKKGKGPCGPLVPYALHILGNLSQTSSHNAKTIARDMEQQIPEHVWRAILRLPPLHRNTTTAAAAINKNAERNADTNDDGDNQKHKTKPLPMESKREESRTALLQLARILLSTEDSTVLHYIGASGSKDRKLSAGILVLALKDGLRDTYTAAEAATSSRKAYYQEISQLLRILRNTLHNHRGAYTTRRWIELLSHDVLQNLCDLSHYAPVLAKPELYTTVLDATDDHEEDLTPLQEAGQEARRFLWPLLVDAQRSPLLQVVQQESKTSRSISSSYSHLHNAEQNLVRTMVRLLDNHPAAGRLAWQQCLCRGLTSTPAMLPTIFSKLTMPDSNKQPFSFLARLRFISSILKISAPIACKNMDAQVSDNSDDSILQHLLPQGLKKIILSKALQSKNAMVVAETIKCMICVLQRAGLVHQQIDKNDESLRGTLCAKLSLLLPDLQVILSTLSRFDLTGENRAAPILCGHLCQLLLTYASTFPTLIEDIKFDWIKLLPGQASVFCSLPLPLQSSLLKTLETILKINHLFHLSPASYELLMNIMTTTRSPEVYSRAQSICQFMLELAAPFETLKGESRQCLKYEIQCWVDCISVDLIPEFCSILEEASHLHFKSEIFLLQAWKHAALPPPKPSLLVSNILMAAMTGAAEITRSDKLNVLLNQVLAKCLLYHDNPLQLAASVIFIQSSREVNQLNNSIVEYSSSLVRFGKYSDSERAALLRQMVNSIFSQGSFHCQLASLISEKRNVKKDSDLLDQIPKDDSFAAMRQLLHMLTISSRDTLQQACLNVARLLLPTVILESTESENALLMQIFKRFKLHMAAELNFLDLCSLSSGKEVARDITLGRLGPIIREFNEDSLHGMLSTPSSLEIILTLLLCRKTLTFHLLDAVLGILISAYTSKCADLLDSSFAIAAAESCAHEMLVRPECGTSRSRNALLVWIATTDRLVLSNGNTEQTAAVASTLENLLCRQLSNSPAAVMRSYAYTLHYQPRDLVLRALSLRLRSTNEQIGNLCLIQHFVECDPNRFSPVLIDILFGESSPEDMRSLWMSGSVDKAILSVVVRGIVMSEMGAQSHALAKAVVGRAITCMQDMNKSSKNVQGSIFQILHYLDRSLLAPLPEILTLAEGMARYFTTTAWHDVMEQLVFSTRKDFIRATILVKDSLDESHLDQRTLTAGLVACLCEQLPRALRKMVKAEARRSLTDAIDPAFLLQLLLPLTGKADTKLVRNIDPACTAAALRACLKYGMAEPASASFAVVAGQCLRLAQKLVLGFSSNASDSFPTPKVVYEMIVSHSHFAEAMVNSSEDLSPEGSQKLELVRLMLACVSTSTTQICVKADIWGVFFRSYRAGVGPTDASLRRLFYTVAKRKDAESLPYMDQFRWNGVPEDETCSKIKDKQLWDWLVNGLQLGRVRQTLRCFPLHDALIPAPLYDLEEVTEVHAMEIGGEYRHSSARNEATERSSTATRRPANDTSYSPGYVLPLILAALESCTGEFKEQATQSLRHGQLPSAAKSGMAMLTRMAQRLCEKGGLSLALASLCSKCPALRQVALSVISFFMWAIDSEEAREITSWRERPQLAMLLHSVHRALAVRRAILMAREEENGIKESATWSVPCFPGFSAVFLARAAFALTRPGESMFVPLNKFFLSIDSEHGAFRDMNRLPAFITFLCSSSDDPDDQARDERLWALKLFKAGFLDESCFKMVAACHAPELLLTTIYNHRMRRTTTGGTDDEECLVLLEAVETMMVRGGRHAMHQLVGRMGLLSWLRTVLESPLAAEQVLRTQATQIAFLELLAVSVRQATTYEAESKSQAADEGEIDFGHDVVDDHVDGDKDCDSSSSNSSSSNNDSLHAKNPGDAEQGQAMESPAGRPASDGMHSFALEISSLARATTIFCSILLGTTRSLEAGRSSLFLSTCLEALVILKTAFQSLPVEMCQRNAVDGSDLQASLTILSKVSASSLPVSAIRDTTEALMVLPMSYDADETIMCDFVCQAFSVVTAASNKEPPTKVWLVHFLTRVSYIISIITNKNCSKRLLQKLLQKLLECGIPCFQYTESRNLWFVCLQHVLVSVDEWDDGTNATTSMEIDGAVDSPTMTQRHAIDRLLRINLP